MCLDKFFLSLTSGVILQIVAEMCRATGSPLLFVPFPLHTCNTCRTVQNKGYHPVSWERRQQGTRYQDGVGADRSSAATANSLLATHA